MAAVAVLLLFLIFRPRIESLLVATLPVTIPVGGFNGALSDVLLPIAMVSVMWTLRHAAHRGRADYPWFFVAFLMVMTTSVASLLVAILHRANVDFAYGAVAPVKLIISFAYLFVFYELGRTAFERADYALFLVWTRVAQFMSGLSIIGVVAWSRGIALPFNSDFRATGLFDDANLFAAYLLLSIGITLAGNRLRGSPSVMRDVNVLPLMAALVLTGSRAVLPAVVVGLLTVLLLVGVRSVIVRPMLRVGLVLSFGLLALTLTAGGAAYQLDAVARFQSGEANTEGDIRFVLWRVGVEMGLDHPFLGVGIGQFRAMSSDYLAGGFFNIPHNTYVSFFAETGLLGLLSFLIIPGLAVHRLRRAVCLSSSESGMWLLCGLCSVLAQALTLNLENSRALWAVLGLAIAFGSMLLAGRTQDSRAIEAASGARSACRHRRTDYQEEVERWDGQLR
jgi:O-antigen ligase